MGVYDLINEGSHMEDSTMAYNPLTYPTRFDTLDDIFISADIEKVLLTSIDTVLIEATIRKTGDIVSVERNDLDEATSAMMAEIDRRLWLLDDICNEFDITPEELRSLLGVASDRFANYADGYEQGWADAIHYDVDTYEAEEWVADIEADAYDEGYVDGTADATFDVEIALDEAYAKGWDSGYFDGQEDGWAWAMSSLDHDPDYLDPFDEWDTWEYDSTYPSNLFIDANAPVNLVNAINPTLVAAAQPFEIDDNYWEE